VEIDPRVEPLVRETLTAVITKDPERFQQAIQAFPDDDAMTKGVRLAVAVGLFIVQDQYGPNPTQEQIREIADDVATVDDWTDISSDEVATYVVSGIKRVRADTVFPLERFLLLSYVIAGYLLSFHSRDDEEWWDYLDRAEATIEATPEPANKGS
jgi:hypothetical protein